MKNRFKVSSVVILIILGVITASLLSKGKISHAYNWKADDANSPVSLYDYEMLYENVEFNPEDGKYIPATDDPWMMFSQINAQYEGVLIKLKEPSKEQMEVKMYYTKEGDDALSESRTRTAYFDKGESSAFVKLPDTSVNIVRLDIAGECIIDSITVSKGKLEDKSILNNEFIYSFILKFIFVLPVLIVAYMAHAERISNGSRPIIGILADAAASNRRYEYDYIRTLAALLVIMMHSVIETFAPAVSIGDPGYFILKLILSISLVCNVLYIMLSGAFLLKPSEESIAEFYKKRLGKVIIPTLSYYLLYVLQGYPNEVFRDGIGNGVWTIVKGLITSRPEYMLHMWFVYAILSLYILAPFLRIMVSHITKSQLFGLILAGFIFDIGASVCPMFGLSFGIDTPVASWMGVFLLGYYMTLPKKRTEENVFMLLGALGLIATIALVYYHPEFLFYESNWAPLMWLEGAGIFTFFTRFKNVFGKRNVLIASVSKYNFSIMLVHVLVLMKIVLPVGWRIESEIGHLSICIAGMIVVSFVLSYVIALLYDNTAVISANYVYKKIFK